MLAFHNNYFYNRIASALSSFYYYYYYYYNYKNRFILKYIDIIDKLLKFFLFIVIFFIINQITPVIIIVEGTILDTSNNMLSERIESNINSDSNNNNINPYEIINDNSPGGDGNNDVYSAGSINGINNIGNNIPQSSSSSLSSTDMLFIRHGRSRVRHSNEKDHIRWGLQAFDNLTLDYDIDAFDNDSIIINTGNGNFLFGSDIWALNDTNGNSYFNQTALIYNNGGNGNLLQKSRNFQSSSSSSSINSYPGGIGGEFGNSIEDINSNNNNNNNNNVRILHSQQQNSIIPTVQLQYSMPTQSPALTTIFPKKKLRKKKIMENIKKNVDKGLEYLKSHQDLDEEDIKLPIPVVVVEIKQPPLPLIQQQQQQQQQQYKKQKIHEQQQLELEEKAEQEEEEKEQENREMFQKHLELKKKKKKQQNKQKYRNEQNSDGNSKHNQQNINDNNDNSDDDGDFDIDINEYDSVNKNHFNHNHNNEDHDNIDKDNSYQNDNPNSHTSNSKSFNNHNHNSKNDLSFTSNDDESNKELLSSRINSENDGDVSISISNSNSEQISNDNNNKNIINSATYTIPDNSDNIDKISQRIVNSPVKENNKENIYKKNFHRHYNQDQDNNKENVNYDSYMDSSQEFQEKLSSEQHSSNRKTSSSHHNENKNNKNSKKQNEKQGSNIRSEEEQILHQGREKQKQQEQNDERQTKKINNKLDRREQQHEYYQHEEQQKHQHEQQGNDKIELYYENNFNTKEVNNQHKSFESYTKKSIHFDGQNLNEKFMGTNLTSETKIPTTTIINNNKKENMMMGSLKKSNVKSFNKNQFQSSSKLNTNIDDNAGTKTNTNTNNNDNHDEDDNIDDENIKNIKSRNHHKGQKNKQQQQQMLLLQYSKHSSLNSNNNQESPLPLSNQDYNNKNVASNNDSSNIKYKLNQNNNNNNNNNGNDKRKEIIYSKQYDDKNINDKNENSQSNGKYIDDIYDTMNDETFGGGSEDTIIGTDQDTILLDDDNAVSSLNSGNVGGGGGGTGVMNEDTSIELNLDLDSDTKYPGTIKPEDDDYDDISRKNRLNLVKGRDVVTKFLQIVETQHLLGANCKAGTALNLGEGVVDRYAQDRFRVEAEVAVNRANMLTRIFKNTSPEILSSEPLLHASVISMVAFDDDIFAAGHCFDWDQHPSKSGLFCPFAYRLPPPEQGAILAKDLALEYHYLGNTSEWFFQARKNAENVVARNDQFNKAFHLYSNSTLREEDEILAVKYEDGRWSKPYYDCGGGNIWMLTYTVPFFGYDHENLTYFFKGTSGIDIDLRRVDIDQCPQRYVPGTTTPLNIFAGTDKCKQRTTMCVPIPGLGFRRGSYKCICRKGFYFPDTSTIQKYFNGSVLEEEYEKLMLGDNTTYSKALIYECLPCAEGCDYCEDASPCVAALNWPMRTSILVLACAVIGFLPPATWFTFRYQQVKVVRAASPALLRVIALGAFFIYCTTIVMYPHPSLYTCTARVWLREIGFSLTYGALMLKTWRISVIFRVRSAKAVKITDAALLKRLGVICAVIGACLLVRTIVSPPDVVVGRTADDLKAFLCKTDWWDYTFTSMEVLFLAWGVRLCIMVRKAPSEFNESRFISMAIYNEFLLTCFLNVSMLFLQSPANPDLLFIIFFCHTQLTVTLLLGLIFGSKVYIVLRSGKSQEAIAMGAKSSGAKFNFRPQIRTFANPSTSTSTAQMHTADTKLSDQEALEEIRQLSYQLQRIQESAPPKGIAVMTISSLLESLRTTSQQLSLGNKPIAAVGGGGAINNTTVANNNISNLPIFAINDIQKYAQNNNTTAITSASPSTTTKQVTILQHSTTTTTTTATKSKTSINNVEKSINTSLTGDEFLNKINNIDNSQQQKQQSPIICSNCSNIISKVSSCNQIDSPTNDKNILSFSNLKLECMCSESIDDDFNDEYQQHSTSIISISNKESPTKSIIKNQESDQYYQLYKSSLPHPIIKSSQSLGGTHTSSSSLKNQKLEKSPTITSINSTTTFFNQNSNSLIQLPQLHQTQSQQQQNHQNQYHQQQSQITNHQHHHQQQYNQKNLSISSINNVNTNSNLKISKTIDEISISLSNVAQKLEAHSTLQQQQQEKQLEYNKNNSKCDNQNKNNFLICDNCKNELLNVNNDKILCNNIECSEYNRIINILNKDNSNRNLSQNSISSNSSNNTNLNINNRNNKIKTKIKNSDLEIINNDIVNNSDNLCSNNITIVNNKSNNQKNNIELNIIDSDNKIQPTTTTAQHTTKCIHKLNKEIATNETTTTTIQYQKNNDDDDISFHSTDDSSCYDDDCTADGGISEGSILASTHYNLRTSRNSNQAQHQKHSRCDSYCGDGNTGDCSPLLLQIKTKKLETPATVGDSIGLTTTPTNYFDDNDDCIHNLNLCDESVKSITGSCSGNEENLITTATTTTTTSSTSDSCNINKDNINIGDSGGVSGGGGGGVGDDNDGSCIAPTPGTNSNNSSVKKRKNKNDKLVLDLNDRTKYTKEVSV